jgi:glutathione S-transferase
LEAAEAPYELEEVSLYGPNGKPDWFMKLNPKGQVPILVCYGGAVIVRDSDTILDNIGKVVKAGSDIFPTEEDGIARAKHFRSQINEFLPIGKQAVLGTGAKDKKMWSKLQELDQLIVGPYVCGEHVTVADCAGFPFLWRIDSEYGPIEEYGCDNIRTWLDTCKKNEAFSKTIQPTWWWWW